MLVRNSTCTWLSDSAACAATMCQLGIGLPPLAQFRRPLLLGGAHLVDQLFEISFCRSWAARMLRSNPTCSCASAGVARIEKPGFPP